MWQRNRREWGAYGRGGCECTVIGAFDELSLDLRHY
jgi:hypothetical protein